MMSQQAIWFFVLAAVLIWGGLAVTMIFYFRKPEVSDYPPGGEEELPEPPA